MRQTDLKVANHKRLNPAKSDIYFVIIRVSWYTIKINRMRKSLAQKCLIMIVNSLRIVVIKYQIENDGYC